MYLFIYMKGKVTEWERQTARSAICCLLPRGLQWPGLGKAEAGTFIWVSRVNQAQGLTSFSAAFSGTVAGSWIESAAASEFGGNASIAKHDPTCYSLNTALILCKY